MIKIQDSLNNVQKTKNGISTITKQTIPVNMQLISTSNENKLWS